MIAPQHALPSRSDAASLRSALPPPNCRVITRKGMKGSPKVAIRQTPYIEMGLAPPLTARCRGQEPLSEQKHETGRRMLHGRYAPVKTPP